MMYDDEIETLPREALEALQFKRLKQTVEQVYALVPFYKEAFRKANVTPDDIKSLKDLHKLPFTTKDDLRDSYPYGMFSMPIDKIVRVHASSGTTGKPTVVGYSKADIETWAQLMARSLVTCGITGKDIIQNAYGYGLFTGGLGVHYGAEKLGSAVIPISGGNTKKQIMIMIDFKSTVLTATPSYAQFLADTIEEMGLLDKINLRVGVFGAEPWSENMRQKLEEKLKIQAMDIYGLSEIMGPGVAIECEEKNGLHIWEDAFIPEIIDPDTLEPLEDGQEGELVITTIKKQAMPLIRYRTKDITRIIKEPCRCGRTHRRIQKILGRSDDMIIIRGVNVFPSQIESVLMEIEGVAPHYQLIVDRVNNLDTLEIQVEVDNRVFSDEIRKLQTLQNRIQNDIKDILGITAKVTLVEPRTIERSEGKAKRVIDKRKI